MTFHPIVSPVLLALLAVVVGAARVAAFRPPAGWRWAALTAAAVLLLVAAARPVIGSDERTTPAGAADGQPNVFLIVDRSPGMGVADLAGGRSRMDAVREDVAAVLDKYPEARFGVITFASGPSVEWPLSPDTWSLRPVMSAMTPYPATPDSVRQTNVAAAGNVLRYQLIAARQQFPRARNLVFYFGAGAGESQAPQRQFDLTEDSVDGGAVLGYGTAAGGVIPQSAAVRSSVDEPALRAVADQIGVPYVLRDGASNDVAFLDDGDDADEPAAPVYASTGATETYWALALGAAVLILVELYLALRDFRRTRSIPVDVAT